MNASRCAFILALALIRPAFAVVPLEPDAGRKDDVADRIAGRLLSPGGAALWRAAHGGPDLRGPAKPTPMPRISGRFGGPPRPGYGPQRINSLDKDLVLVSRFPDSPPTTQSETNIAVSGASVVVGYNDSAALYGPGRSISGYSYSSNSGQTWTDGMGIPSAPATTNVGDPGLAVDRHGNFYYAQIVFNFAGLAVRGTLGVSKSTNGGRTFAAPVDIYAASPPLDVIGSNGDETFSLSDKELIGVDNSGGPRDGTVYVAWNQYSEVTSLNGTVAVNTQIRMVISSDGGVTWSSPVAISPQHHFTFTNGSPSAGAAVSGAVISIGPDGSVYVAWEEIDAQLPNAIERISRSDDGSTFTLQNQAVAALNQIGNPFHGIVYGGVRINEFPDLDINRLNGALYLVYSAAPSTYPGGTGGTLRSPGNGTSDRADVYLVRSTDRGQTWSAPVRVNDDSGECDQFFPCVSVAPNGTLGVSWYDRRNDPYNERIDLYAGVSTNGGASFTQNVRVTAEPFPLVQTNPNFDEGINDNYMGDYIDMTNDGTRFLFAWGDNRDIIRSPNYGPRPDPNVYFSAFFVNAANR